jgi:hypothetical protein
MPRANDSAWEKYIAQKGLTLDGRSYRVDASVLKEVTGREPRLLAKYDAPQDQPKPFRQAGYTLLPVTNGSYLLFKGSVFAEVPPCGNRKSFRPRLEFPLLTVGRGSGESEYLDNAYNTGLLSNFTGSGRLYLTIRGRERTKAFGFHIGTYGMFIEVSGVQIEVDAGFEGEKDIVLVEAKIGRRAHFNLRQLYYPFRHFSSLFPTKKVRPLLFTYDLFEGSYTFHEFTFAKPDVFDSLIGVGCCVYTLSSKTKYRVEELLERELESDSNVVPQADDLNKVLELLSLINSGTNTVQGIADHFVFDARQSNYYGEAAEYLGLISRSKGEFELTDRGRAFLMAEPDRQQNVAAKMVINSWVFRGLVKIASRKGYFKLTDIDRLIAGVTDERGNVRYTDSTIPRRRKTIISWLTWLTKQIGCFEFRDGRFFLI